MVSRPISIAFAMIMISVALFGLLNFGAPPVEAELSNSNNLTGILPISITSDSDFTLANGVVSGTGTTADPYIIENWSIDGNASAHGIEITGVTKDFVIRNCLIFDGAGYYGIYIHGDSTMPNAVIENVNVTEFDLNFYGQGSNEHAQSTSTITILNSTFKDCTQAYTWYTRGYNFRTHYLGGTLIIENCTFEDAYATNMDITYSDADLFMKDCQFIGDVTGVHFLSHDDRLGHIFYGKRQFENVTFGKSTTGTHTMQFHTTNGGIDIMNSTIEGTPGYGVEAPMYLNLTNVEFYETGDWAVQMNSGGSSFCDFINVTIDKCNSGLNVKGKYNNITQCKVTNITNTVSTRPLGIYSANHGSSSVNMIYDNTLIGQRAGIWLQGDYDECFDNVIMDTWCSNDDGGSGIFIDIDRECVVRNNTIINATIGLNAQYGYDATIYGNWITDSDTGVYFDESTYGCTFYSNYVYDNEINCTDDDTTTPKENAWNETYIMGGGNYWGNYSGVDNMNGENQDIAGRDGIGDNPYYIDDGIADYYPLMNLPDYEAPTSRVKNMTFWFNDTFMVPFEADDNAWLKDIGLMYSYAADNTTFGSWVFYDNMSVDQIHDEDNFTFDAPDGDGWYQLQTNATDAVGLMEVVGMYDQLVAFDSTPAMTHVEQTPATLNITSFDVVVNATDAMSGVYMLELWVSNSSDGTTWSDYMLEDSKMPDGNLTNFTFNGAFGQTYKFYSRSWDIAMNYEDAPAMNDTMIELVEDIPTIPVTTINIGTPMVSGDPVWITSATEFELEAVSAAGIDFAWYSLDDGATYEVFTTNFTVNDTVDHIFYGALDLAMNNETANRLNVSVDDMGPVTTLTIVGNKTGSDPVYVRNTTTYNLMANDAGVGTDSIYYKVDDGAWMMFSTNFSIAATGAHIIYFNATDLLGNVETTQNVTIEVVEDLPDLKMVSGMITYSGGLNDGEGAAEATVELMNETAVLLKTATSNATGFYSIYVEAVSNVTLKVTPATAMLGEVGVTDGYLAKTTTAFDLMADITQDVMLEHYTVPVVVLPTLMGTVTYSGGPNDGEAAINATIELRDSAGTLVEAYITPDGAYEFLNISVGYNYSLKVIPEASMLGVDGVTEGYLIWEMVLNITADLTQNVALAHYADVVVTESITITAPTAGQIFDTGATITVSGTSTGLDGQTITVTIDGVDATGTIGTGGAWSVDIIAPATANTFTITVAGGTVTETMSVVVEEPAPTPDGEEESFFEQNMMCIIVVIIIIVVLLAVVGAVIFFMMKKKEEEVEEVEEEDEDDYDEDDEEEYEDEDEEEDDEEYDEEDEEEEDEDEDEEEDEEEEDEEEYEDEEYDKEDEEEAYDEEYEDEDEEEYEDDEELEDEDELEDEEEE